MWLHWNSLDNDLINLGHNITVVDIQWFGNYLKPHKNLKVIKSDIRDHEKIPLENIDTVIHLASIANDQGLN